MKRKIFNLLVLVSLVFGMVLSAQPAMALSLPEGTTISSATLHIFVHRTVGATVNVHRVTSDWTEMGVTWEFLPSYDPAVITSFTPAAGFQGFISVDITALVQGWVNGDYPNYGILLEQGASDYTRYASSENNSVYQPFIEVCFDGTCEIINNVVDNTITDAWVWELDPDDNGGSDPVLYTGLVGGKEKLSLLRFGFELLPPPPEGEGCTPGYWRQDQHFDSWVPTGYAPNDDYDTVFGVTGLPTTLLNAVWAQGGGENALARHAVAALLNAASPDVDYAYSVAEVLAMVQAAYASGNFEPTKDLFEYQNEMGCPLD